MIYVFVTEPFPLRILIHCAMTKTVSVNDDFMADLPSVLSRFYMLPLSVDTIYYDQGKYVYKYLNHLYHAKILRYERESEQSSPVNITESYCHSRSTVYT